MLLTTIYCKHSYLDAAIFRHAEKVLDGAPVDKWLALFSPNQCQSGALVCVLILGKKGES